MAITQFIPEIWNASMLENFHERSLAAGIANRQYEGDATKGNTVHITGAVDIEVEDYAAAGRTTSASAVSDTTQELVIDQEKSFDFYIDDIDRAQAAGSLDAYTRSAGQGLATDADKFLWNTAATAANAVDTSATDVHNIIRDMRKALNKLFVPHESRYLVVNAEFEALLLDVDAKLTSVDTSGSPAGLRNATLGQYLGFQILTTENVPVTEAPFALGLYSPALAFVSQLEKTEAMRAQDKFADRLRGLHVYGGKVIERPDATVPAVKYDATPDAGT